MWDTDKNLEAVRAIGFGPPPKDQTRHVDPLTEALADIYEWRLAMRGSDFVPPEVFTALEFIIDAGAYRQAGNDITDLIRRLWASGELRGPIRSWRGQKISKLNLSGTGR